MDVRKRFVSFGRDLGCGLADELHLLCAEAGFQPRIAQEVDVAGEVAGERLGPEPA